MELDWFGKLSKSGKLASSSRAAGKLAIACSRPYRRRVLVDVGAVARGSPTTASGGKAAAGERKRSDDERARGCLVECVCVDVRLERASACVCKAF